MPARFNFPLFLTWLRIVAIPLFVAVLYVPESWIAERTANIISMWIFIAAAVTDWLDGYLARRWNQITSFGAFLDPVADKLMVAAALIVLTEKGIVRSVYDPTDAVGRLLFNVLAMVAEFESDLIRLRTREA